MKNQWYGFTIEIPLTDTAWFMLVGKMSHNSIGHNLRKEKCVNSVCWYTGQINRLLAALLAIELCHMFVTVLSMHGLYLCYSKTCFDCVNIVSQIMTFTSNQRALESIAL